MTPQRLGGNNVCQFRNDQYLAYGSRFKAKDKDKLRNI